MREIKFRCWDKNRKEMLYSETRENPNEMLFHWDFRNNWCATRAKDSFVLGEGNAILMQYTGLKDKNNLTEIYEGDIVKWDKTPYPLQIKWRKRECGFNLITLTGKDRGLDSQDLKELEIIGNIYENKELLNAQTQR